MKRYLNGDIHAFTEIYDLHKGRVHSYLQRRIGRNQDADELLQSVFLKFHQSRHQFTFEHSLLQWFYVISRTTFIDFYRKDRSHQNVPFDPERDEMPDETQTESESGVGFEAIKSLPTDQQDIIRARLIDDESYGEIAARLNRSESSIRQIFSRAMKKLKTQLSMEQKNELSK